MHLTTNGTRKSSLIKLAAVASLLTVLASVIVPAAAQSPPNLRMVARPAAASTSGQTPSYIAKPGGGSGELAGNGATGNSTSGNSTSGATAECYQPVTLRLTPKSAVNRLPEDTTERFTATVKDQTGAGLPDQTVSLATTFGTLSTNHVRTGCDGTANFTITSTVVGTANITATSGNLTDTATKTWYVPTITTLAISPKSALNLLPGDTTERFTVTVRDQIGLGMPGQTVNITASFGTLSTPSVLTGPNGTANFTITSTVVGTANITATLGALTDTATKTWYTEYTPAPTTLALTPKSALNLLPGDTTETFTVTVRDQIGLGMAGQSVNITASFGTLSTPSVLTGPNGTANFTITSTVVGTANITATSGNLTDTATKTWYTQYTPTPTTLAITPKSALNLLPGDTTERFTVTVRDQIGLGLAGQTVNITASFGTLSTPSVLTRPDGTANFTITSTAVGTANITATLGSLSDTATKTWYVPAATTLAISPKSALNLLPGDTTETFTVTVRDQMGFGLAGQSVNITASFGSLSTPSVLTGPNGTANFTITSTVVGTANITATSGNLTDTATKTWYTEYTPAPTTLALTPKSALNLLPGDTTERFTVTVRDQIGLGLAGQSVNITATFGTLSTPSVLTGPNGTANFTITSTVVGTANITATSGNLTDTATKTWYTQYTPAPTTLALTPKSALNLLPGDTTERFTVTVRDQIGLGLAGQSVNITASFGTLSTPSVLTGPNGTANFTITSTAVGTANITATLGALADTATKTWYTEYTPAPTTLALTPKSALNLLPGDTTETFTVTVRDQIGLGMAGQSVNITASFGTLSTPSVLTGPNGTANFTITSTVVGTANITATSGNLTDTATKTWYTEYTPAPTTLALTPKSALNLLPGDTTERFTVTVRDQIGLGLAGQSVNITATFGTLSTPSVLTGPNGTANFTITSTVVGTANITATSGNLTDTATKTWYTEYTPAPTTLALTPKSALNLLPGDTTERFTVTVRDQIGLGLAGQSVNITASFGTLSTPSVLTGPNGTANFTITSTAVGTANITATLGALADTATKTWYTEYTPAPTTLALTPESAFNLLPGDTTETFTVTVRDQMGFGLAGQSVNITASFGSLSTPSVLTGPNGTANFTITSTVVGTANITATSGNLTDTATKTWYTEYTPAPTTLALTPKSALNLLPGDTTERFTVTVRDQIGLGLAGQSVNITATFGTLSTPSVLTGPNGTANFTITSTVVGTANITATSGNLTDTATKTWYTEYTPAPTTLALTPKSALNLLPGDTTERFTVTVRDQIGLGLAGQSVNITATFGTLSTPSVLTGPNGTANFTITSTVVGTANITATLGALADTATKTWYVPTITTLAISPKSALNLLPGDTTETFTVTVRDQIGLGLAGQTVNITASFGSLSTPSVLTGPDGTANFTITSTVVGTANITATLGALTDTATKTWYTEYTPAPTTLAITPKSALNLLPGDTTETFTVTVRDQIGLGMAGQSVNITASFGTLSTPSVLTGPNGTANFTITSTVVGTANITATLDALTDTATKTWYTEYTPAPTTLALTPKSALNLLPGDTTERFTVTVRDQIGLGLAGQSVNITATFGTLSTPSVLTGPNGTANFTITSTVVGTANITATLGALADTATKTWYVPTITTLAISPKSALNLLPGDTTETFTVTVRDQMGFGLAGQTVNITASFGTLSTPSVLTRPDGTANFTITSTAVGTANITATLGSLSDTATKTWYVPAATTLAISPKSALNLLPGDTTETFTVTVRDQMGFGLAGQSVNITATFGSLSTPSVLTGPNGTANFTITSTVVGTANITATSGNLTDTATKTWYTEYTPAPTTLALTPESAFNLLPGDTTETFTVTVRDQIGLGLAGQSVNITASFGTLSTPSVLTGPDGTANFTITSTVVGTANITATLGALADTATKTWYTSPGPGPNPTPVPTTLTLSPKAALNILPGDPTETFTATVKDQFGTGMSGQTVSIAASFGTLSSTSVVTGAGGSATFTISSAMVGTANITATLGSLTDTATKTWGTSPGPGPGPGPGPEPTPVPPSPTPETAGEENFTVDFLGRITHGPISAGGELLRTIEARSPDGEHILWLEAGTKVLDSEGRAVRKIEITAAEDSPDLPYDTTIVGRAYEFAPTGVTFTRPMQLTLAYDIADLPPRVASVSLAYYAPGSGWTDLKAASGIVAELGRLTAPVEHFTVFAVLARPTLELANLSVAPALARYFPFLAFVTRAGHEATVTIEATNQGNQASRYSLILKLNGAPYATSDVTIKPHQTQKVTFTLMGYRTGSHVVEIGGLRGEFRSFLNVNWWLIAAALVVLGAGYWAIFKKALR